MAKGSAQVAHLWVEHNMGQPVKPLKKNTGQGSNFYWDEDTIYSYGRHFPIARFVDTPRGKCVFFTRRTYSVTTGGHISEVRQALHGRGLPVFYLDHFVEVQPVPMESSERACFEKMIERTFDEACKARQRGPELCMRVRHLVEEAQVMSDFFDFGWAFKVPEGLDVVEVKGEGYRTKAAEALKAKHKEAVAWDAVRRAAWLEGRDLERPKGLPSLPWDVKKELPTLLRIVGDTVETSRGAVIPLKDAIKGLAFLDSWKALGHGAYDKALHQSHYTILLGDFTLDSVSLDGTIKAGCHTILKAEVDRFRALVAKGRA